MPTMNKRKISTIILFSFVIWGWAFANEVDNFIGMTEIRTNERVKSWNSYLLESSVPGSRISYSASIIQTFSKDFYFLIEQNVSEDPKKPIWKVVSQFKAPCKKDENYFYCGGFCSRNGKQDRRIIALVLYQKDELFLKKIERAWILNTESLTIERISPEGIICENESYGVD